MAIYRCYFVDGEHQVRDTVPVEADSLSDAIGRAKRLLARQSYHHAIELWLGPKRLFVSAETIETPARS